MMISTRGRYALRVMIELAERYSESYVPMREIAEKQGVSLKYMERIVPVLIKNNMLAAIHGKGGGYRLSREPHEYTVGELLRLTEGSLAPVTCLECETESCERAENCRTVEMWKGLYKILDEYFDGITIADLMKTSK